MSGPARTRRPRRASRRRRAPTATSRDSLGRAVEFTGYDEVTSEGAVRGIVSEACRRRAPARARRSSSCSTARRSTPRAAVSSPTRAIIELDNGARLEVYDVQSPITGLVVHKARVLDGEVSLGGHAQSLVDTERRQVDQPLAHRDAHGAQGLPRGARRDGHAGRLGELARAGSGSTSPPPVRCRSRRWATSRRGSTTSCWRTSGCTRRYDPGGGGALGRDGALR